MSKFALPLIVVAALVLTSVITEPAQAAVRRVFVPGARVYVAKPLPRVYRTRVVVPHTIGTVIYRPWTYGTTVIVPRGNQKLLAPAPRPILYRPVVIW